MGNAKSKALEEKKGSFIFKHPKRGDISFPTQHDRDNFARIHSRLHK